MLALHHYSDLLQLQPIHAPAHSANHQPTIDLVYTHDLQHRRLEMLHDSQLERNH
jgi:hypothetical protein